MFKQFETKRQHSMGKIFLFVLLLDLLFYGLPLMGVFVVLHFGKQSETGLLLEGTPSGYMFLQFLAWVGVFVWSVFDCRLIDGERKRVLRGWGLAGLFFKLGVVVGCLGLAEITQSVWVVGVFYGVSVLGAFVLVVVSFAKNKYKMQRIVVDWFGIYHKKMDLEWQKKYGGVLGSALVDTVFCEDSAKEEGDSHSIDTNILPSNKQDSKRDLRAPIKWLAVLFGLLFVILSCSSAWGQGATVTIGFVMSGVLYAICQVWQGIFLYAKCKNIKKVLILGAFLLFNLGVPILVFALQRPFGEYLLYALVFAVSDTLCHLWVARVSKTIP
ncbi:MAG: hypothetical protein FWD76_03650 [Firmicutes bacterium]|nr:hypothetical protein [Bacillota bacterium]